MILAKFHLSSPNFTQFQIQLPPKFTFPDVVEYRPDRVSEEYGVLMGRRPENMPISSKVMRMFFVHKVILSSSPCAGSDSMAMAMAMAMAIYGEFKRLALCRSGDNAWTFVYGNCFPHDDIIFYNHKFYAVRNRGEVLVMDMDNSWEAPKVIKILPRPPKHGRFSMKTYLVDSSGELLMIGRYVVYDGFLYTTTGFRVYMLNYQSSSGGNPWFRVKSLGDRMLFLGLNSSLSYSSFDFPGCKGNCIYFMDDHLEAHREGIHGGYHIGVFNLEDSSINTLPGFKGGTNKHLIWPPPVWVTPNPC